MKLDILAVGKNMPDWINTGVKEYLTRFPSQLKTELVEVTPAKRSKTGLAETYKREEAEHILARIPLDNYVVALEVTGKTFDTPQLAKQLQSWIGLSKNISLIIGGPDGLDASCIKRADLLWSLSPLTFPHPLVRVILVEQLYRAWSLLNHHPYHRE
ncbi:MAG: 23S rRNA (pseudouridine(1915)-N(3))-methyltransferase RlmH [Gammaproteobacteria bacterium]